MKAEIDPFTWNISSRVWVDQSLYNELKAYLDHYLGLLTGSYGKVNENQIDKVSLLNDFLQVYNVRYYTKVQQ